MPKKVRVLSVGTEVVVVKDTVFHHIPKGTITKITFWDGSVTAPAYRLEGYDTGVWYTDIKPTSATTIKKPKEPKTMSTTKKPGTTHGKPTVRGMKVEKKPATAKPKYPAARVQRELIAEAKPLEKRTKAKLIETAQDLAVQFHNLAADHCIAGTKLDRALVDLKEAKAKIKELTKGTEAVK